MTETAISREVPLDQLILPPDDVREGRPEPEVRSIASSMGDPDVGQQQPITVYPNDWAEAVDEGEEGELDFLFQEDHPMVVHDGVTRFRAAEMLGWETLWAVIVARPPENEVVARLEANTERLDMSDYEVYSALYDHYQTSEATLQEVGEKIGVSESYVSQVFGLFDSPDWLRDPWRDEGHPLNTSHALAVRAFLSENTVERYAETGGLDDHDAYQRAVEDARLMIDVQAEHDLGVTEFRDRCQRCQKETVDQLQDQRSLEEKRADGQTAGAEREEDHYEESDYATATCLVCGADADRKIAVDVCREDYGMLSDMKANDEVLMAQAEASGGQSQAAEVAEAAPVELAGFLEGKYGLDPESAQQVQEQLEQEFAAAREGQADD